MQVADAEQEEGKIQREEQEEESDGRPQRCEQEDCREDEPALDDFRVTTRFSCSQRTGAYHEYKAKRVEKGWGSSCFFDAGGDLKPTGGQNDGEREPEPAVGRQRGGAESIAYSHFPAR